MHTSIIIRLFATTLVFSYHFSCIHCIPVPGKLTMFSNVGKMLRGKQFAKGNTSKMTGSHKSSTSSRSNPSSISWPDTTPAVNFPSPIKTPGTGGSLSKKRIPIDRKGVHDTIRTHREELNAYHLLHRNYAATHGIGTSWSQSQIVKDANKRTNLLSR